LIHIDEHTVEVDTDGATGILVIPPSDDPTETEVAVWPDGWPHEGTNTATFTYEG
jgi:hypothetical protein